MVVDHLSRISNAPVEMEPINENFPDEYILVMCKELWYADIVNYLVTEQMPDSWTKEERLCFLARVKWFFWDEPYLFKYCPDQII